MLYTLYSNTFPSGTSWDFNYGNMSEQSFVIESNDYIGGSSYWNMYYHVLGVQNNELFFAKYNNLKNQEFEFIPVENFRVKSIKFINDNTAKLTNLPDRIFKSYYTNNSPVAQTRQVTISEEVTETSQYSQKSGTSLTIKTTIECGVPFVIDSKIETTLTTSYEYTYGKSESQKRTISSTFPLVIPAKHHAECQIILAHYKIDVEYEAICVGETSGREIKIRGRWSGVSVTEDRTVVNMTSLTNSRVKSATFKGIPKTTVRIR